MKVPNILVVDDEPMNHEVIHAYLEGDGYTLIDADSGEEALELAKATPPDLVLLDVMMPGLNGFETAQRLKDIAPSEFLPIIFVTALDDQFSRVLGLRTHADEFLTKPVDRQELSVRVSNLLTLRFQKMSLLRKNIEHVELHRFKDEMSSMIVHDLKNPMAAVLSNLEFVLDVSSGLDESQLEALRDAHSSSQRAVRLIHNLLDVASMEANLFALHRSVTEVAELVGAVVRQRATLARKREITVSSIIDGSLQIEVDRELLTRVIENLFDNAFRYTPPGGRIQVLGKVAGHNAAIEIGNTGPSIEVASRHLIFEKFGQSSSGTGRMNLGLGLYFCRLAVEAHGGRIWVDETETFPTLFTLELPAVVAPAQVRPGEGSEGQKVRRGVAMANASTETAPK